MSIARRFWTRSTRGAPATLPVWLASGSAWRRAHAARCPARPGGDARPGMPRLASPQVGAGLVGAGAGGNRAMAGAVMPFAVQGMAARSPPGRELPAGAPLLYRGGYPVHQDGQCRDDGDNGQEIERRRPGMIGIGAGTARI